MSVAEPPRRRGPAAGASRDEVLARTTADFLACRRIDVQAIAADCGVGRATIYRWFGSRERLIGEAMLGVISQRIGDARGAVPGQGAEALVAAFDLVYRGLVAAPHVRAFIERDRGTALPLMTSSSGPIHPRLVELVQGMIEDEVKSGAYDPPADPGVLAYVLVRLTEGLLFNYAEDDVPKDLDRLREAMASLLGASRARP